LKALPDHHPTLLTDLPAELIVIDMQEESDCVITFLNECVQKCLRMPSKYVEALRSLAVASAPNRPDDRPSPLLMTLLEHLQSRVNNTSTPPAHIVAITAFIGRLTFCLLGKNDLGFLRAFVDKVENVLMQIPTLDEGQNPAEEMVATALKRELQIMRSGLTFNVTSDPELEIETEGAERWLAASEALSIRGFFDFSSRQAAQIPQQLRRIKLERLWLSESLTFCEHCPCRWINSSGCSPSSLHLTFRLFLASLNASYRDKLICGKRCDLHLNSLFSVLSTCH